MNDTTDMTDGYGISFTPHAQMFHVQCIRSALEQFEKDKAIETTLPLQAEWKEKPAGYYEKGSGI